MKDNERIKVDVYDPMTNKLIDEGVTPNDALYAKKDFLKFCCHVCHREGSLRKRDNGTVDFYSQKHKPSCFAGKRKDYIELKTGGAYFDLYSLLDPTNYKDEEPKISKGGKSFQDFSDDQFINKTKIKISDDKTAIRSLKHFITDIVSAFSDDEYIPMGSPTESISILKKDFIIQRKYFDYYIACQDLNGIKILFDPRPTKISEQIKNQFVNTIFLQDARAKSNWNKPKLIFMLTFPSDKSHVKFCIKYFQENIKRKDGASFKRATILCKLEYDSEMSKIIGDNVYRSLINPKAVAWLDDYNI